MSEYRRLRVLLLSPTLTGGGAERFASNLLCQLDRRRFEPHLCLIGTETGYPLASDVPVYSLGKRRPWQIPRAINRLRRRIETLQPDALIGTMLYTNWMIGAALRMVSRPWPFWIARFASSPLKEYSSRGPYGLLGPILRFPVARLVRDADRWVANSAGLAGDLKKFAATRNQHIDVMHNPLDLDRISKLAKEPVDIPIENGVPLVVFVGRLSHEKRLDLLLSALARLLTRRDVRVWICGDGPLRASVIAQVHKLGLATRVRLLGFQQNPYRFVRKADLLVLCSDFEGLPNALIEAQGLGVPVVATRCQYGPDEIVENNVTGLLVPVGDVEALTNAIDEILADPERARSMGREAAERIRHLFDPLRIMEAWDKLISEGASRECAE